MPLGLLHWALRVKDFCRLGSPPMHNVWLNVAAPTGYQPHVMFHRRKKNITPVCMCSLMASMHVHCLGWISSMQQHRDMSGGI